MFPLDSSLNVQMGNFETNERNQDYEITKQTKKDRPVQQKSFKPQLI